jgi:apolipoprotein D and lipocalin family protein
MGNLSSSASALPPLQVVSKCETAKFMGTWFVIGVKPTMLETTCSNAVEKYSFLRESKNDIDIDFQYNNLEDPYKSNSKLKSLPQKGWVQGDDKQNSGLWKVSPFWPIKMPYLILEVDDKDYMYTVVGYPSRAYAWILYRQPQMPDALYDELRNKLETKHGYNLQGLRRVPQLWTAEERAKRGFTKEQIPDAMLVTKVD